MTESTAIQVTKVEQKINQIRTAMMAMPVGSCGVKWDNVVWRISETGWIVGEVGVRRDGYIHDLESVTSWYSWKRGLSR